jgi:hypothetical protein
MRGADAMFFKKPSMSGFLIEGAHRVEPLLLNREAVKKVGFYLFQWLRFKALGVRQLFYLF